MFNRKLIAAAGFVLVVLVGTGIVRHLSTNGGADVDFNQDIRPILNENCVTCHGGVKREAELSLLFREGALEPAESGRRAIVPSPCVT